MRSPSIESPPLEEMHQPPSEVQIPELFFVESQKSPENDAYREFISDACMSAQARILIPHLQDQDFIKSIEDFPTRLRLQYLTKVATSAMCEIASAYSAAKLARQHGQDFKYITMLKAWANQDTPFVVRDFEFHTYVLAQDHQNEWHAASPANYNPDYEINPLTTIFSDHQLDAVIQHITESDGGTWPSSTFIEQSVEEKYKSPDFSERQANRSVTHLNALTFESIQGFQLATVKSFPIMKELTKDN